MLKQERFYFHPGPPKLYRMPSAIAIYSWTKSTLNILHQTGLSNAGVAGVPEGYGFLSRGSSWPRTGSRDSTPALQGSPPCQECRKHHAGSDAEELSCLSIPSQPALPEACSVSQQYREVSYSLCSCFFTWTIYQTIKLHTAFTHTNLLLPVKQCSPGQRLNLTADQHIHRSGTQLSSVSVTGCHNMAKSGVPFVSHVQGSLCFEDAV